MYPYELFLGITLYDIFILIGIIAAFAVFLLYAQKCGISAKLQSVVLLSAAVGILCGFVFATLVQSFYDYLKNGIFVWGRMTFYGGFIGGALFFLLTYFVYGRFEYRNSAEKDHIKQFLRVLNIAVPSVVIAHAFGRIGCLTAGCCHGRVYSEPHAFRVPLLRISAANELLYTEYAIPVQLYEALFLFALFAFLSVWSLKGKCCGFSLYLILYGVWRFLIEFARGDDRGATLIRVLSPSQLTAILLVLVGVGLLIFELRVLSRRHFEREGDNKA